MLLAPKKAMFTPESLALVNASNWFEVTYSTCPAAMIALNENRPGVSLLHSRGQRAPRRVAGPLPQLRARRHAELGGDVGHVVLDRVEARPPSSRDLVPIDAVTQPLEDLPLGRREDVGMGRSAAAASWHDAHGSADPTKLPSPPPSIGRSAGPATIRTWSP